MLITNKNESHRSLINQNDLKETVIFLSEKVLPRDSQHPENLDIAAEFIKQKLSMSSASAIFQSYAVNGNNYKNVIASFGPDTKEVIVIGAHYDAFSTHAAADDNASGVAGLIELGKLLGKVQLKHRILLVAYTLEEPPYYATEHMGSFIHAASLKDNKVRLMISLEMIGFFTDSPGSQSFPMPLLSLFYPDSGDFIAVVDSFLSNEAAPLKASINKYTDVQAYSINAPRWVLGIDYSDHRSYWSHGYPAIMVTDTSFYRNHQYHQEQDTYERLNYKKMAEVVYGVFQYIQVLDAKE
ncbi:M28 family peptidase [Cellvibrio zantedeschiae]|uniref:M28 family peptidase n=1 Tax=Cellvibrio zantedeschiae TaxID=1237077 RepID=UPI001676EA20|nr:M28 family peptidase [Cellvibrio zantedeschiae]